MWSLRDDRTVLEHRFRSENVDNFEFELDSLKQSESVNSTPRTGIYFSRTLTHVATPHRGSRAQGLKVECLVKIGRSIVIFMSMFERSSSPFSCSHPTPLSSSSWTLPSRTSTPSEAPCISTTCASITRKEDYCPVAKTHPPTERGHVLLFDEGDTSAMFEVCETTDFSFETCSPYVNKNYYSSWCSPMVDPDFAEGEIADLEQ